VWIGPLCIKFDSLDLCERELRHYPLEAFDLLLQLRDPFELDLGVVLKLTDLLALFRNDVRTKIQDLDRAVELVARDVKAARFGDARNFSSGSDGHFPDGSDQPTIEYSRNCFWFGNKFPQSVMTKLSYLQTGRYRWHAFPHLLITLTGIPQPCEGRCGARPPTEWLIIEPVRGVAGQRMSRDLSPYKNTETQEAYKDQIDPDEVIQNPREGEDQDAEDQREQRA
jgi:hypothetical protein